ncbi:hypothetical protein [Humisphaera borealis]|uniref:Uncharacterized protein n=1 Tax=Humisphaera borealis TaxID=2807512 RepID=A0A7M2WVF6_9BACT|nr:hypothetical protein [Humisphaera borealis]QOV89369.1 hypothetical protein IPV69_24730 [Humisphaera borealis]
MAGNYTPDDVTLLASIRADILSRSDGYQEGARFLLAEYGPERLGWHKLTTWERYKDHPVQLESHRSDAEYATRFIEDVVARRVRFGEVLAEASAPPTAKDWSLGRCVCAAINVLKESHGEEHHDCKAKAILLMAVMLWDAGAHMRHPIFNLFGPWGATATGDIESISRWAAASILSDEAELRRWMDTVRMAWAALQAPTSRGQSAQNLPDRNDESKPWIELENAAKQQVRIHQEQVAIASFLEVEQQNTAEQQRLRDWIRQDHLDYDQRVALMQSDHRWATLKERWKANPSFEQNADVAGEIHALHREYSIPDEPRINSSDRLLWWLKRQRNVYFDAAPEKFNEGAPSYLAEPNRKARDFALEIRAARRGAPPLPAPLNDALAEWQSLYDWCLTADSSSTPDATHSTDFVFVRWFGTEYTFAKGVQSSAIEALWKEWQKTGLGLHQDSIRQHVDDERDDFRMDVAFRNHPAFGTMIQRCGDGRYRLVAPEKGNRAAGAQSPLPPKKKSQIRGNHV